MFQSEDDDEDVLTPVLEVWHMKMELSRMLVRNGAM